MKWIKLTLAIIYVVLLQVVIMEWNMGLVFNCVLSFPFALWIVLFIHEMSHALLFWSFGFPIKQFRFGLFEVKRVAKIKRIELHNNGMFYGCCTVDELEKGHNVKIILSLLVGGLSGFLICIASSLLLFVKIVPNRLQGELLAIAIAGGYSFCVTLLIPTSGDRLQIKKIKEESK